MKKTMILGLCLALIASIIMIGGEVKAATVAPHVTPLPEVTPQASASVDKTTLKKEDIVTLTVKFPRDYEAKSMYSEQYLIKFDNKKFSYIQDSLAITGYNGADIKGIDCYVSTDSDSFKLPEDYSGDQIYVWLGGAEGEQIFSGFSVQFKVKEDLTEVTSFKVSDLNEDDEVEDTLDISVNPVETEPQQPDDNPADQPNNPQDNPTDEPTNQPNNSQENSTNKPADENTAELDDTPQTGVVDYVGIAVAISMLSMLGVVILRRKK